MNNADSGRTVSAKLSVQAMAALKVRQERAARMAGQDVTIDDAAAQALEEHLLGCAKRD